MKSKLRTIKHLITNKRTWITCCIVFFSFYISSSWVQVILIQGKSMYPTYKNMQLALLNKKVEKVVVGDVIAFNAEKLNCVLVKRVVAVPGDSVQIENNTLYVNGIATTDNTIEYSGVAKELTILSEDEYFVMGDNWPDSKDSRYVAIGCIESFDIIGRIYPQKRCMLYKY